MTTSLLLAFPGLPKQRYGTLPFKSAVQCNYFGGAIIGLQMYCGLKYLKEVHDDLLIL